MIRRTRKPGSGARQGGSLDALLKFMEDDFGLSVTGASRSGPKMIRDMVPLEEWLENPFYVGEDGARLYDFWKQEIKNFYDSGKTEWIIFGSLGGGKSTAGVYATLRKIYELSCWDYPALLYGLMKTTVLWMLYFSVSLTQAERTGFGTILRTVRSIPYFRRHFSPNPNKTSVLEFPSVHVTYGSDQAHQIGLDLYGTILDEGDFFTRSGQLTTDLETFARARKLYEATIRRRKVRFNVGGEEHGLSILISSPSYHSPFAETRIERNRITQTAYVTQVSGYKVAPKKFSPHETFWVFLGADGVEPRVLDTVDSLLEVLSALNVPHDPVEARRLGLLQMIGRYRGKLSVRRVPIDFIQDFRDDPAQAVQDVLGISLQYRREFIPMKLVRSAITSSWEHPFTRPVISLSTLRPQEDLVDYFEPNRLRFPASLPRAIHIDQSYANDRTGMACSLKLADAIEGDEVHSIYAVEWMLSITPPSSGEIPLMKLAEFALWLAEDLDLNIRRVTFDSFQSRSSIQHLRRAGIDSDAFSVDKTDEPYLEFKRSLYDGRVMFYEYEPFLREIPTLHWDRRRRKVDHDTNGAKDVADAVVGSLFNAQMFCDVGVPMIAVESARGAKGRTVERMVQEVLMDQEKKGPLEEAQWETVYEDDYWL